MIRDVVSIDEDLCDGCGECVPACAEGAVQVIDGKAGSVSDALCDGLGACLGHCPRGAIKTERREAAPFDELVVQRHIGEGKETGRTPAGDGQPRDGVPETRSGSGTPVPHVPVGCPSGAPAGCPSSRFAQFAGRQPADEGRSGAGLGAGSPGAASELTHWPIQLRLLPPSAPILRGARLLVAADCVPVAYAGFQAELLRDHAVVIACPKLDDTRGYVEKLTEMIRQNDLAEITVAHMEVPCCTGILQAVLEARGRAGSDLPVNDVVIGIQGQIVARRRIPVDSTTLQYGPIG